MYKIMIIEDDLVMAEAIAKEMNAWGNEAVYVIFRMFFPFLPLRHRIWSSWISRFLSIMDTTGAARYGKCRMYR